MTTDAFGAAQSTIDQSRLSLLKAMQAAGSQGRAAYEAGQADLAAQRQSAVGAAIAAAGGRGAPAELQGQLAQTVAQPFDRNIASLRAGAASREGDLAARRANTESYLGEVSAAMPVVRAQAERQLAELRARAAEKAGTSSMAAARLALDREKFEYEKTKGSAPGADLSDSELNNRLMGVASLRKQQVAGIPKKGLSGFTGPISTQVQNLRERQVRIDAPETLARRAGVAAGIDPVRVHGVVPAPKAPASAAPKAPSGFTPAEADTLRTKDYYRTGASMAEDLIGTSDPEDSSKPFSRQDFIAALGRAPFLKNKPRTRALIIAEYGGQFPGS